MGAWFSADGTSVTVTSEKDLYNVVLEFADRSHQKFEGLTLQSGEFQGTCENTGKPVVGCWVKSGTHARGDGPGYGKHLGNPRLHCGGYQHEERPFAAI
ncbi:MAG: hypothetical protein HY000_21610 [Planctomycetes bacterium]|nr:hypothetical protein [Planctomycetota bacterium]